MKNLIDKLKNNDVVVRAVKTFIQSFAAVMLATDNPASKSAVVAAFAAAISAAWNSLRGLRS